MDNAIVPVSRKVRVGAAWQSGGSEVDGTGRWSCIAQGELLVVWPKWPVESRPSHGREGATGEGASCGRLYSPSIGGGREFRVPRTCPPPSSKLVERSSSDGSSTAVVGLLAS